MGEVSAQRGRATRQRLLDAAVSLIGEVGWSNVTTRLVAERAGVNPGLVHYHFASVSTLLTTAATGFTRELLEHIARQLTDQPDVGAGLDRLLAELSGYTGTDPACLLLVEAFLASSRLPDLRVELAAMITDFRTHVADWLRAHGHGAEADTAAAVLAGAIDGLMLHRAVDPNMDITALAEPLRRMLIPGGTDIEYEEAQ
ncbi:MAG: TetR/AcrR family transcriptional regulator [Nocardiopsaceae bacterium]|nr:TetR/AcrR family transcriptional regulator [Nocardiopsaceae bacterium]